MLPCQRSLFDIPREVCYLNAAGWGPLPLATQEAARAAAARKGRPWLIDWDFANLQYERARKAAAALIDAAPQDVALISSVAYGVATAAKLLDVPRGARVIVLADDHSSPVLEWMTRGTRQGFAVEAVRRSESESWTDALLAAIARTGAAPVALASISSVHWSDGGIIDVAAVAQALKRHGARLLVDATHGAGVLDLDVRAIDPDFVVFPTYKWLLGPYGRAFLYVAPRHQNGEPLEQTSAARRSVKAEQNVYMTDLAYVPDGRRFDMGERDHFISMEMAAIGAELLASWGAKAVRARLQYLTRRLADGLDDLPVSILPERMRTPHIVGVGFPGGMPSELAGRLAVAHVYAAPRIGRLRVSPHVYNDEADIDRFVSVLRSIIH